MGVEAAKCSEAAVTTQPLKKLLLENVSFGLSLEGLAGFEHWPTLDSED